MFSKSRTFRIILALLAAAFFLSACISGPEGQPSSESVEETPVPTPTRDPSGYQAVPPQSCLVGDWPSMQSDKLQGDLVAWQPGSNNLAYLSPAERSSWYIGDLMLAKGPDFKQKVPLAPSVLVGGDMTWSPGGRTLAFLAFRPNENVYTIMTVKPDGSGLTDLFPTDQARTDSRTSQKSILGWVDENTLRVMASCGEECRQAYDISLDSASAPEVTPTPVTNYHDLAASLQIHRNTFEFEPAQYPKGMSDPNWSPDGNMIAYLDKRGYLWLLSIPEKISYLVDIGLRDVAETQWSEDNHYLGIRAEDRIFIFQVPCEKPLE